MAEIEGWHVPAAEKHNRLVTAYDAAYRRRDPCDLCGERHPQWHHATVLGQNMCHDCYEACGCPCTQLYAGDLGYPPWFPERDGGVTFG